MLVVRRSRPTDRIAIALLVLFASSCGRGPRPRVVADFLPRIADAELRTDSLDLAWLAADSRLRQRGLEGLERTSSSFSVRIHGHARLRLPFFSTADKELRLRAFCRESPSCGLPIEVSLNDRSVGQIRPTSTQQNFTLILPQSAQLRGENTLAVRPEPTAASISERTIELTRLDVCPVGAPLGIDAPALSEGQLRLTPSSSVGFELRLPRRATIELTTAVRPLPGKARLTIQVDDDSGVRLQRDFAHKLARSETFRVPIDDRLGQIVRVSVANTDSKNSVFLSGLRLTTPASASPSPTPRTVLPGRPSVIIYLVDALRADRLGTYGWSAPTSPRLDAFARQSLVFEDAWAQASWTRSAVASIFTGLHVSSHGVDTSRRPLSSEVPTLAQAFKNYGYRTGAFVGNAILGGRFGYQKGFDTWNDGDPALDDATAPVLGERALRWVSSQPGPFFLYLHTMEPHFPYVPSGDDGDPFGAPRDFPLQRLRQLFNWGILGKLDREQGRVLEPLYLGEIRGNDRAFGSFIDGLRDRSLLDRSIVAFTADHGEEMLDHGHTDHGLTLYQEVIHVPLVVRLPHGQRGGIRSPEVVQQIDLMPTLLALVGASSPRDIEGRDLSAGWLGVTPGEEAPPLSFSEQYYSLVSKTVVRAGSLKLVLNGDQPEYWRAGARVELYDLSSDPGERVNLASRRPIAAAFLRQEIRRFRQAIAAAHRARPGEVVLTPEERERLRALGYIGGPGQ